MGFIPFIYNTLAERANNKKSEKYWLPKILMGIDNPDKKVGGKLIPPRDLSWDLGKIKGATGDTAARSISTWYGNYLKFQEKMPGAIGVIDPEDPNPSLSLSGVTLYGINNLRTLDNKTFKNTPPGYDATIPLEFNYYDNYAKLKVTYTQEQVKGLNKNEVGLAAVSKGGKISLVDPNSYDFNSGSSRITTDLNAGKNILVQLDQNQEVVIPDYSNGPANPGFNAIGQTLLPKDDGADTGLCYKVLLLPFLGITGDFLLTQKVANLKDPANEGNPSAYDHRTTIKGTGNFSVVFTTAICDARIFIGVTGSGPNRKIRVDVKSLHLRGATPSEMPTFVVNILNITKAPQGLESIWTNLAESAFNAPDGQQAIVENINTTLNDKDHLASLSETMTKEISNSFDNMTGTVPPGGLPDDTNQKISNAADLYFFDRVRTALNNKASDWYLPKVLLTSGNPGLEPLNVDKVDLGAQKIGGLTWSPNTLSDIVVKGISNNMALEKNMILKDPILNILTEQGKLNSPTGIKVGRRTVPGPPLNINGKFSCQLQGMSAINGTFSVKVTNSHLNIDTTATGDVLSKLQIFIKKMVLVATSNQIVIKLKFPKGSGLDSFVNQIVDKDSVKQKIIAKINDEISKNLTKLSNEITKGAKQGIAERLDG